MSLCIDKLRFTSSKLAKKKAKQIKSKAGYLLATYKCHECGGYHMTSKVSMGYKMKARGNTV
tara:strand:- start:1501 stop:1686 length:186 start_codon:yes stop_codon:yes gene_type:complete